MRTSVIRGLIHSHFIHSSFCLFVCLFLFTDASVVPMSQRNFPASFWNPLAPSVRPLCRQRVANYSCAPRMPPGYVLHHPTSSRAGKCCEAEIHTITTQNSSNQPNRSAKFIQRPLTSATSAPTESRTFTRESAGQRGCYASQVFNPQYNGLLVHPDFQPYLPLVPGQPTGSQEKEMSIKEEN